ncbi:MAG: SEC-C domain-containing protein, partial [Chloroflexi bacterium]|nr:SEC-C domain-containing protein [Chloroflexota bacterium]
IVKRLYVREDDLTRLAKKFGVNPDPFAAENANALHEIFGVADSAGLDKILRGGIPHSVLNAKEHEREAHVIARAGEPHTITLATNMAGRGVDIKLGGELPEETLTELARILHRAGIDPYNLSFDQIAEALDKIPPAEYALDAEHVERFRRHMNDRARVRELGGLRIVGTERHEARRIDNQLRGRSGRQGDAGSSRFYVSIEDEIMRRMGGKGMMDRVWIEDIPIEHDWVTRALEQSQVKMEGYNFDIRKHLLEYDDVLNKQREIIYGQRFRILTKADLRDDLRGWAHEEIARAVSEELKAAGDHAESRLLARIDALMPGFYLSENELVPPYSLELILRELGEKPDAPALLAAARRALELHRDFLIESVVPETLNQFEAQYQTTWGEIEDLAKNTLATAQQEAQEQNRRLDAASLAQTVGRAVGMNIALRGAAISEKEILDTVRRNFDLRVVDQIARRVVKRAGVEFQLPWGGEAELEFTLLRDTLTAALEKAYAAHADKTLAEIERELTERGKPENLESRPQRAFALFSLSHARRAIFDQRTHRRMEMWTPRFPWLHLAAEQIGKTEADTLKEELGEYWSASLAELEHARGGAESFNDLLRELMLSVVTSLWVDYLTDIEELRTGIGLQAFGQRDPLVEYKRRAFAMFQELYTRIRTQVVGNIFTYQYRGLAKLESASRDHIAPAALPIATPAVVAAPTSPPSPSPNKGGGGARVAVASRPTNTGTLGRNDPCWCGSGKKYKHCHMKSDK